MIRFIIYVNKHKKPFDLIFQTDKRSITSMSPISIRPRTKFCRNQVDFFDFVNKYINIELHSIKTHTVYRIYS